jgi:hypothetical protein
MEGRQLTPNKRFLHDYNRQERCAGYPVILAQSFYIAAIKAGAATLVGGSIVRGSTTFPTMLYLFLKSVRCQLCNMQIRLLASHEETMPIIKDFALSFAQVAIVCNRMLGLQARQG